jgi:tungstate transport system substrate-binding protein
MLMMLGSLTACQSMRQNSLRLATTTSPYDSGLLDAILPDFEQRYDVTVDVLAVGTGQALALGERGDVDVVLVHDPMKEDAFVAAGHGVDRSVVMYNDFVLVGPDQDPAGVRGLKTAAEAFQRIAQKGVEFASRGDQSGTHARELQIWEQAGFQPSPVLDWYLSLGQSMGATLQFANERRAYTLTDRGTYLSQRSNLPNLDVMVGGGSLPENPDESLLNCYSVIIVNPGRHPEVNFDIAQAFEDWITAPKTKASIGDYGVDQFGQVLFYPAEPGCAQSGPANTGA